MKLEDMFEQLDALVEKLEKDSVSLEESFQLYNQGMEMIKNCNASIDAIEKKVQLIDQNGALHEF